jgi:ATP-binding cassette, subfamily B, bacterial CvaB/MchF/RaxB
MALGGGWVPVAKLKERVGESSRGLTLRQLRDLLRGFGAESEVLAFDPEQIKSLPVPSILLLSRGHYIVCASCAGDTISVFYPELGWTKASYRALKPLLTRFAVVARNIPKTRYLGAYRRVWWGVAQELVNAFSGIPLAIHLTLSLTAQVLVLILPSVTGRLIDGARNLRSFDHFGSIAFGYLIITLLSAVTALAGIYVAQRLLVSASRRLGSLVLRLLTRKPVRWYESLSIEGVRNAVASFDALARLASQTLPVVIGAVVTILVCVFALAHASGAILLTAVPLVLGMAVFDVWTESRQTRAAIQLFQYSQLRQRFVADALFQTPVFVRHGTQCELTERYLEASELTIGAESALQYRKTVKASAVSLLRAFDTLLFSVIAATLMQKGMVTLGEFIAAGVYKNLLSQSLTSIIQITAQWWSTRPSVLQAYDLMAGEVRATASADGCSPRCISLRNVSFRYGSLDPHILSDVSLFIPQSQFVCIAGPSGVGKSTIAKLIAGVEQPTEGAVIVGDAQITCPSVSVVAVLQSDKLMDASIKENISLFSDKISDAAVFEALEFVELGEFVRGLPMGLLSRVSDSGGGISAGQRQRILLARAIVRRPGVLILDEATSNLDVATEAKILTKIKRLGSTVLLISHRPEAWSGADLIYDLAAGALRPRDFNQVSA